LAENIIDLLGCLMMTLVFAGAVHAAQPATDGNIQGPIDHDVFVIDQDVTIKGENQGHGCGIWIDNYIGWQDRGGCRSWLAAGSPS